MPEPKEPLDPTGAGRFRERLSAADRSLELLPWRRAHELTRCFLYWVPTNSFPVPADQREWLLRFFGALSESLTTKLGLREEIFFRLKEFYELRNSFLNHQREFMPMCGLGRRPGAKLPDAPTEEEIKAMSKAMMESFQLPDGMQFMPDYCYWFSKKSAKKQRELFLGHAALTIVFLKPDPKAAPPQLPPQLAFLKNRPELKQFDFQAALASGAALQDSFLAKSKELFGVGLEEEPQFKGLPFILPLLSTADFFGQPAEESEKWFQLFDVYINESPVDKGILMAFKADVEEQLIDLLNEMKKEGLEYPER